MDFDLNRQAEETDQEECIAEVEDSEKRPLPVRFRIRRHGVVSADPKKLTCPVCNTIFRSPKSLHGHMRSHPDRGYKGMQPPKKTESSSCSEIADVAESGPGVDLPPRGWSVKKKRGRPVKEHDNGDVDNETKNLMEAAEALLLLSVSAPNPEIYGDGNSHVCKKCDKRFDSGQALGGHQSIHRHGNGNDQVMASSSSSSTSPPGQQITSKKAVAFPFDLNELPQDNNGDH